MIFLNRLHRVATVCGATPLFLGTAIFVGWIVTRSTWLVVAGVVTLYVGLAVVAAGVVALALSCWTAFRTPGVPRQRVWLSARDLVFWRDRSRCRSAASWPTAQLPKIRSAATGLSTPLLQE